MHETNSSENLVQEFFKTVNKLGEILEKIQSISAMQQNKLDGPEVVVDVPSLKKT